MSAEEITRGRGRPLTGKAPDKAAVALLALRSFAEFGYDATSLRQIATQASVDVALVARLYGSKQALWTAVIDLLAERMTGAHLQIAALMGREMAARDRLVAGLRLYVESHAQMPELFRFFANEMAHGGMRRDHVIARLWQPHCAIFVPLLQNAMEAGVLPEQDPELLLLMLAGAVGLPLTICQPDDGPGAPSARLSGAVLALCGLGPDNAPLCA